ncbi:hypothetical protein ACGFOM_35335 [Streptomyces sp. NPDC048594]|uniref:hypothetical protein n=1 Tax=Streptomyces sp. NPDC048594 TaxID=3365575 RepID=UPI0037145780
MAYTQTTGRPARPRQSVTLAADVRSEAPTPCWHTARRAGPARPGGPRAAERLLRTTTSKPSGPAQFHAARVLLHTGNPHRTAVWCDELRLRAPSSAWAAGFGALRSEALLQLGETVAAEHEAAAAIAREAACARPTGLLPWSTAVLAESLMAQGRHEEAAAHLDRPVAVITWSGLPWLRARGRLHLARGRPRDALTLFSRAARLARRHGAGVLPYLSWRGDTAEALLALGRADRARTLLTEELAASAPGPRDRGIALRLLAATEEPGRRLPVLSRAATELRRCKDHVELAQVLAECAHTLDTLGEPATAAVFHRRAADLGGAVRP